MEGELLAVDAQPAIADEVADRDAESAQWPPEDRSDRRGADRRAADGHDLEDPPPDGGQSPQIGAQDGAGALRDVELVAQVPLDPIPILADQPDRAAADHVGDQVLDPRKLPSARGVQHPGERRRWRSAVEHGADPQRDLGDVEGTERHAATAGDRGPQLA